MRRIPSGNQSKQGKQSNTTGGESGSGFSFLNRLTVIILVALACALIFLLGGIGWGLIATVIGGALLIIYDIQHGRLQ